MTGLRILFVVSGAASLLMVGVGMIVALLPQRVLDLTGSLRNVGYAASFFAISYLIVQLPVGALADRFGVKPFLLLGYLLCCVSGLVFFSAGSAEVLFLGRFIQGAGEAPIWALGPALLSLAYPHAKGKMIGIYNAAIHAGLTIGSLIGIAFFAGAGGSYPFLLFSVLCCCGAVIVMLFFQRAMPSTVITFAQAPRLRELAMLLRHREPMLTLSGILLYGASYGVFTGVLPASLSMSGEFDSFDNGVFFALFYLAISISQLIVGPLSDRHDRHVYMVGGLVMAAIGLALLDLYTVPVIYLPLMLASFGLGVFCVSSMAYLNECVPDALKAAISSSYYLAWGTGYFLGPLLVGLVADTASPRVGNIVLGLLIAVQALALVRARPARA